MTLLPGVTSDSGMSPRLVCSNVRYTFLPSSLDSVFDSANHFFICRLLSVLTGSSIVDTSIWTMEGWGDPLAWDAPQGEPSNMPQRCHGILERRNDEDQSPGNPCTKRFWVLSYLLTHVIFNLSLSNADVENWGPSRRASYKTAPICHTVVDPSWQ